MLAEQRRYYEARAGEYDDWFNRVGRYDRGAAASDQWFAEVAEAQSLVDAVNWRGRRVLEMAPGTGLWTVRLLHAGAASITAVDASPAMLEHLRGRLGPDVANVTMVVDDLFSFETTERFDAVFFGFWISHVPRARLGEFLVLVRGLLAPGGVVVFVDSKREATSTAHDHSLPEGTSELMVRRLDDGREYRIVKNFFEPDELVAAAAAAGVALEVTGTERYFIVGVGTT